MGYHAEGSAPIGLHYGGPAGVPVLVALAQTAAANRIAISFDAGLTWQLATAPNPIFSWQGGAFSPSLGYGIATSFNGLVARAMASDPLTWVDLPGNLDVIGFGWNRCIRNADDTLFVAVGTTGGGAGNRAATSPDGAAWTLRLTPAALAWAWLTALGSGRLIANGGGGVSNTPFMFSDDGGLSWALTGALPGGRIDNAAKSVATDSTTGIYFPSDFGAAPFSDYTSADGGALIAAHQVNPPVPPDGAGGGVTAVAMDQGSGTIIRCDGTGIYRTSLAQIVSPTPMTREATGGAFNNVQDMIFIPRVGFVGLALNGAVLQHVSNRTGAWVATATAIPGDYRRILPMPFD